MLLRDGVRSHPKVLKAGAEAAWVWTCCIDYSRQQLTDGFVPTEALPTLANCRGRLSAVITRLIDVGLLHREDGGVRVHDYLDHNDSADEVKEAKRRDAERKRGIQPDSGRNPSGIQSDSKRTLARARGVGVGNGDLSEGWSGPGVPIAPMAEPYAEVWRLLAASHGVDLCLGFSRTDSDHLIDLAAAYSLDDFRLAARTWWDSPHTGGRNLGLFMNQIAEVLAHARSGATWPFRGKAPLAAVEKPGPTYRKAADVFAGERL